MAEHNYQLAVPDMTCGGCAARVKQALSSVPGVDSAIVNLGDHTVSVTGDVPVAALLKAVKEAGYSPSELNITTG